MCDNIIVHALLCNTRARCGWLYLTRFFHVANKKRGAKGERLAAKGKHDLMLRTIVHLFFFGRTQKEEQHAGFFT